MYTACKLGHGHEQWERKKETTNEWGWSGMREKKRRRNVVIFQFFEKDKGSGKWRRNFLLPSSCWLTLFLSSSLSYFPNFILYLSLCHLFLFPQLHFFYVSFALTIFLSKVSISLLFILAQLCLLMTCESGNFPFWFWQWEENPGSFTRSRFLCWLSIDYLWQKTLKYSLACLHPSLSFSVFLTFTLSPALLSLWDFPLVSLSHSSFHSWGQLQLFENRLPCCCWVWEREQGPGLTCGREGEPV